MRNVQRGPKGWSTNKSYPFQIQCFNRQIQVGIENLEACVSLALLNPPYDDVPHDDANRGLILSSRLPSTKGVDGTLGLPTKTLIEFWGMTCRLPKMPPENPKPAKTSRSQRE